MLDHPTFEFYAELEANLGRHRPRSSKSPRPLFAAGLAAHPGLPGALLAEGLNFSTYILIHVLATRGPLTLVALAQTTGLSYHATIHQVNRSPYFQRDTPPARQGPNHITGPLVTVRLTPDAPHKLTRVHKRLPELKP